MLGGGTLGAISITTFLIQILEYKFSLLILNIIISSVIGIVGTAIGFTVAYYLFRRLVRQIKELRQNTVSKKANGTAKKQRDLMNYCLRPVFAIVIVFEVQIIFLLVLSTNISNDWSGHLYEIKSIVLRFPNSFTPFESNATRYDFNYISSAQVQSIALKSVDVINKIAIQLGICIPLIAIPSLIMVNKAKGLIGTYEQKPERPQDWLASSSTLSTTISGAVSIIVALVGAISLLSPGVAGGFLIAGLEILLVCIIVGILVQNVRIGVVKKADNTNVTVTVDPEYAANWQALVIIQFILLMVGISLLVLQVIFFL